jgi:hypothetical protein
VQSSINKCSFFPNSIVYARVVVWKPPPSLSSIIRLIVAGVPHGGLYFQAPYALMHPETCDTNKSIEVPHCVIFTASFPGYYHCLFVYALVTVHRSSAARPRFALLELFILSGRHSIQSLVTAVVCFTFSVAPNFSTCPGNPHIRIYVYHIFIAMHSYQKYEDCNEIVHCYYNIEKSVGDGIGNIH